MAEIGQSQVSPIASDILSKQGDMKDTKLGQFKGKLAKVVKSAVKMIGIDRNKSGSSIKNGDHTLTRGIKSRTVDIRKPDKKLRSKNKGVDKDNNGALQGGFSRNAATRKPVRRQKAGIINKAPKSDKVPASLENKENISKATKQQNSSSELSKEGVTSSDSEVIKSAKNKTNNALPKSKTTEITDKDSGGGKENLTSLLKAKSSKPPLVAKALSHCSLDDLKDLDSKAVAKKHEPAIMARISEILDGYSLEELKDIKGNNTPKEWVPCINGKLIKRQIEENSKNSESQMFRVSGSIPIVRLLDEAVSNKALLSGIKDNNGADILDNVNALSGHVKKLLTGTYKIKGTSEKAYASAFNQLKSTNDKMMYKDVVDGLHAYVLQAKNNPSETMNLNIVAISMHTFYGSHMSPSEIVAIRMAGSMEVEVSEEVQAARDINISVMEDFLKNWPIAKSKMS